ncbi:uncharacterized protein LOC131675187 [Phymastichus coffea]|uniref:uncharacterized protein LOC131675187 n=1 Tax=Phymastichus coffea TaxID=108790 RepID=UPI00273AEA83|nr:uncharacterized protein LOC131675187 [Phymastichus coffea]
MYIPFEKRKLPFKENDIFVSVITEANKNYSIVEIIVVTRRQKQQINQPSSPPPVDKETNEIKSIKPSRGRSRKVSVEEIPPVDKLCAPDSIILFTEKVVLKHYPKRTRNDVPDYVESNLDDSEFEDDFTTGKLMVVDINNIYQFSIIKPKYQSNFQKDTYYTYVENVNRRDVYILAIGDESEMSSLHNEIKERILLKNANTLFALVRFLKNDALQAINIVDIEGFALNNTTLDFKIDVVYHAKYYCTCASAIDVFNKVDFALVWCVKQNIIAVHTIKSIRELKYQDDLLISSFNKNKIYSAKLNVGDTNYSAVQILALGSKEVLEFQKKHAGKRMKKKVFNSSDVDAIEKLITDHSSENEEIESLIEEIDSEVSVTNENKGRQKRRNKKRVKKNNNAIDTDDEEEDKEVLSRKCNAVINQQSVLSFSENGSVDGDLNDRNNSTTNTSNEKSRSVLQPRQLFHTDNQSTSPQYGNGFKKRRSNESHRKTKKSRNYFNPVPLKRGMGDYNPSIFSRNDDKYNFSLIEWSDDSDGETPYLQFIFRRRGRRGRI